MKKVCMLFCVLMMLLVVFSGCTRIEPGTVGIKVVYGGADKGVQDFPALTGWQFYMPGFSRIFHYPTFVQVATWTASHTDGRKDQNDEITWNTKEGLVVSADITMAYQIAPDKVPAFYVKFRTDRLSDFTHGYLRNIVRDSFNEVGSKYAVEEVYGEKKEVFLKEVKALVAKQVLPYGLGVEQLGILGAMRIPQGVKAALDMKIQATQDAIRVENEVRQAKAEAQKTIAKANGDAQANIILAKSLTPTLMEWERLQIQKQTVWRWNGQRPYFEGGGANLMFAMPNTR